MTGLGTDDFSPDVRAVIRRADEVSRDEAEVDVKALCDGQPSSVFFEDEWGDVPYSTALANARSFCDNCPVRLACLQREMGYEKGTSIDYRAGIYAGMTPAQRHSLEKRGTPIEGDPVMLRASIPDRGDQWTDRHTKLARITISWLSDNVEVGGDVPDALALSRQLKVGVKDLRRVYQALIEDHVLLKDKGRLRRRKHAASAKHWTPVHLRGGTGA